MLKPWLLTQTDPAEGADPGAGGTGEKVELALDEIPEQFRSNPSAVFKSYDEARREMDRLRSERDEERAQFAAALEKIDQAQPAPPADPAANPLLNQYAQAVDQGDHAAMLAIQLALNKQIMDETIAAKFKDLEPTLGAQSKADREIAFELAQNRVAASLGEQWGEIAPDVDAWMKAHQSWLPTQGDPAAFEQVIREGVQVVQGQKAAERLAALEQDRAARLAAQTATGSGTRGTPIDTDEKKQAWQEVVNAPVGSYADLRRG